MQVQPRHPPLRAARRRRRRVRGPALAVVLAVAGSLLAPLAAAATPGVDEISVVDGRTAPVFGYDGAVRERVYIEVAGVDQDLDGDDDVTAIDIIRPTASDAELLVPAIIDASPYYTTSGRGREGEKIEDLDADGVTDVWPQFLDNYFVPRGYAVILAHMNGTGDSTGCPMHGGPGDIASMRVVIDWLQGRVEGRDADGDLVEADWHNGKAGMIGKSYDGTLANGVAATGVGGLTTIVPIDAISDWYRYSRSNGVRYTTSHYPDYLARFVTNSDRRDLCEPTRDAMSLIDGDATGDVNAFWTERNHLLDVADVTASVFAVHGLNDDNVRMSQFDDYWTALAANGVPRKVWLAKVGHVDPFDFRRAEWVDTVHRWFDYWLHDVANGIMGEPRASVETDPGVFEDVADWPIPGTEPVAVHLADSADATGDLVLAPPVTGDPRAFTGPSLSLSENSLVADPEVSQVSRLGFLSDPLATDLRISGTPLIELRASLSTPQANLAVALVDYGPTTLTPRSPGDGVQDTAVTSCWGEGSADDDACYVEVEHRSVTTDRWRVSLGVLDSSNRDSLIEGQESLVVPGELEEFDWALEPYDHVFPAGHRIGVVVTTNLSGYVRGTASATVTVDTVGSRILLPIVGGLPTAAAAEGLGAPDPVSLAFDLGGHGVAITDQVVPYGVAPIVPTAPAAAGWVFGGWYADAGHSAAFDFTTELFGDATAYARWDELGTIVDTLAIVPSDSSVDQGDTITVVVNGFDDAGLPLGDVTSFATLESSVDSDVIAGDTVTFVHASPHLITARLGAAVATLSVWVQPAAVAPAASGLGGTGSEFPVPLAVVAVLVLLGGVALVVLRRRGTRR